MMSAATFSMVMSAAVMSAAVMMTFTMVIALNIRVIIKSVCDKCFNCCICFTCYSAVKLNSCLGKSILSTAADTAADKNFYLICRKESAKRAVAVAVCVNNLARHDFSFFYVVHFEL